MQDDLLLTQYDQNGSEAAFSQIVARHQTFVYGTCRRELGSEPLAEDAAQVVFLLLARNARKLRTRQSLAGWLYQTAVFVSKNARKQEARRLRKEEAAMQEVISQQRVPEPAWSSIEPLLNGALSSLKPADREAVLLRFLEGHTLTETGVLLGVSEDAARMRCARALDKLRRYLTAQGTTVTGLALAGLLTAEAARPISARAVEAITQGTLPAISASPTANVLLLSKGVFQTMRIAQSKIVALAAVAVVGVSLATVSTLKADVTPKIAKNGSVHTVQSPAAHISPDTLNLPLVKREQRLSHLTFDWQINDQESSPKSPAQSYTSTQIWQVMRAGSGTLIKGTKQQGTYLGDFMQYYNGPSGIIVNTRNSFNGISVGPVPPLVWGNTGDSIRFREPFQTGFNLMPEHLVLLAGLNPIALYDAHWQIKATMPLTWTLETTVPQGSDAQPASSQTIDLTLSRRLGGAPAKIVVKEGNETWTYQALGYRHQGKDWICDKFSLDFEYPGIQQRKQLWILKTVKPTDPLPPLPISNDTRQLVSDYRRVGLNLTTEQYLDAISQQPSKAVMYAWPGHFPTISELDTKKYR